MCICVFDFIAHCWATFSALCALLSSRIMTNKNDDDDDVIVNKQISRWGISCIHEFLIFTWIWCSRNNNVLWLQGKQYVHVVLNSLTIFFLAAISKQLLSPAIVWKISATTEMIYKIHFHQLPNQQPHLHQLIMRTLQAQPLPHMWYAQQIPWSRSLQ